MLKSASTVSAIPEGVSTKTAALVEPLAVGMHAARLGDVKAPKTVVILGGGCIGLCTLLSCRQMGASKIIVNDLSQNGGIPADKLERIVDKVYDFEETQQAFMTSMTNKQNITKVVIKICD